MPKPKNKKELISVCDTNYKKLIATINSLDDNLKNVYFQNEGLNKNIRDVLCHLHHWHILFSNWYTVGMKGQKPEMPYKGYKWKDTAKLNKVINQKYSKTTLNEAMIIFEKSHLKISAVIKKHSNQELFEKKIFAWTGTTSLGVYLISNTSSHYDWAIRIINKGLKSVTGK